MTPENTMKFYSAFPRLYSGKEKSQQESSMSWGFQCGDGWFDLIWKLSSDIEAAARKEGIDPDGSDWPEATNVKQKFGMLRFYVDNGSEEMRSMIDEACGESKRICEICGKPGALSGRNPVATLCEEHARTQV